MDGSVAGALAKGQVLLLAGVTGCVLVLPAGLTANNGMSYYGVHPVTVPALAASLLGTAWYTRRGLRAMAPWSPAAQFLRRSADAFAVLLAGILLTPYTVGAVLDWTHRGLGSALFILQLVLGVRLVWWTRDRVAAACWGVQLLGGVLSADYVLREHGYLLESQLLFQLGFGALLLRVAQLIPTDTAIPDSTAVDGAAAVDGAVSRSTRPPSGSA